jgi:hypothetical protein
MWLGTKDHWTTWLTVLVNSGEEFTLLGTCLVFRCLAASQRSREEAAVRGERKLHASLESDSWQFGATGGEIPQYV